MQNFLSFTIYKVSYWRFLFTLVENFLSHHFRSCRYPLRMNPKPNLIAPILPKHTKFTIYFVGETQRNLTFVLNEPISISKFACMFTTALWKNVLSKGRNLHGCKAVICKIPCIDCKAVKLSFFCILAIHARQLSKKLPCIEFVPLKCCKIALLTSDIARHFFLLARLQF